MIKESKLSTYWWWRLLVVIYAISYIVILLISCIIGYSNQPYSVDDYSKRYAECANGQKYDLDKYRDAIFYDGSNDDKTMRIWCAGNYDITTKEGEKKSVPAYDLPKYGYKLPDITEVNYSIKLPQKINGSEWNVIKWFLITYIVGSIVLEFVKSLILYIMGLNIWRGFMVWYVRLFQLLLQKDT